MLTAREKFQQSAHAASHKKWAESLDAEAACDYALLAFVEELPEQKDAFGTVDAHARLVGARRYRELLLSLHKPQNDAKRDRLLGPNLKPPS